MASSNGSSSNNQTTHLPDLGLDGQPTTRDAPLKKPPSTTSNIPDLGLDSQPTTRDAPLKKPPSTTSKSTLDTVTLATQNLSIDKASFAELANSKLSVNAPEFVPKSQFCQPQVLSQQPLNEVAAAKQYHPQHQQQQHHSNYNQRHYNNHPKSNANGTNGAHRARGHHWQNNESSYPPSNGDNDFDSEEFYALTYLSDFISQVSAMPHVYDEEILNLTEILSSFIDNEDIVLQCSVNNIIDSAITEPNFRYSAVKLCDHLINNLTTTSGITGRVEFKNELLNRCQREHSRRTSLMASSDKGDYLRGLSLFIADLSTKLTDEPILLNALPDLMEVLLSDTRSTDNVRTVVNATKLCGRTLESSRPDQFKSIVDRLSEIAKDSNDSSISNAINALLELIERSWRPPTPPPPLLNNPYARAGGFDDPLPEEYERTFHDDYNGHGNYHPAYPLPCYDFGNGDENNSEVSDAFEEFLRASGQMN